MKLQKDHFKMKTFRWRRRCAAETAQLRSSHLPHSCWARACRVGCLEAERSGINITKLIYHDWYGPINYYKFFDARFKLLWWVCTDKLEPWRSVSDTLKFYGTISAVITKLRISCNKTSKIKKADNNAMNGLKLKDSMMETSWALVTPKQPLGLELVKNSKIMNITYQNVVWI